jgi:hypothetical protein
MYLPLKLDDPLIFPATTPATTILFQLQSPHFRIPQPFHSFINLPPQTLHLSLKGVSFFQ